MNNELKNQKINNKSKKTLTQIAGKITPAMASPMRLLQHQQGRN